MEPLSQVSCRTCDKPLTGRQRKFCSSKCQDRHRYITDPSRYERIKRYRDANQQKLNQYKTDRGCCKCGFNAHPAALQANHIDPDNKSFQIGGSITKSWESLLTELDKCEIMCANCHSIHTHDNQHTKLRKNT